MSKVDVIVVGAGISGIAAASKLASLGKSVVVLEGRDRKGGRMFTDRVSGSGPYEFGCCWFHESLDNPLYTIAKKEGIEAVYDDGNIVLLDGSGPIDGSVAAALGEFQAFAGIYFLDHPDSDISLKELTEKYLTEHPDLSDLQKERLPGYLRVPQVGNGMDWGDLSAKSLGGASKGRDLLVVGGYDKVYEVVAKPLSENSIKLSTAVTSISDEGDHVEVETSNGEKYSASKVIVTVPIGVLKHGDIKFKPALPPSLSKAISEYGLAYTGKVYLEFDSVFWSPDMDKTVVGGGSGIEYPAVVSNWYKYYGEKKHPGLLIIVPPPLTQQLEADESKAQELLGPILDALRVDQSKPVPKATKVHSSKWSVEEFSRAAYSSIVTGTSRAPLVEAFEAGYGNIGFAGEHTVLRNATFAHGAYKSGLREASKILG